MDTVKGIVDRHNKHIVKKRYILLYTYIVDIYLPITSYILYL